VWLLPGGVSTVVGIIVNGGVCSDLCINGFNVASITGVITLAAPHASSMRFFRVSKGCFLYDPLPSVACTGVAKYPELQLSMPSTCSGVLILISDYALTP
jgi:hypothetical protein